MKTSKVIGLLCTAISGLNDTLRLVLGCVIEDEKITHGEGASDYTHVHSVLAPCAEMVRELWRELPDELRDEDTNKLIAKLYPHTFQDDYTKMTAKVQEAHSAIYAMWQVMTDARNAAEIYS